MKITALWDLRPCKHSNAIQMKTRTLASNSSKYSHMIRHHLKPAIRRERRALLSSGVCLRHDNARPHTARHNVKQVQDLKLDLLSRLPYSPDLAPTDLHILALKDAPRDVDSNRKGGKRGGACEAGTATNTCSPKELLSWWNDGGSLQNVVGTTLTIDVIVLYMFLLYIIFTVLI